MIRRDDAGFARAPAPATVGPAPSRAGESGAAAMNLLALDTSTEQAVLALSIGSGRMLAAEPGPGRRHGRDLIPRLRDLLAQGGIRPAELDAIAVGVGPGSYTGLRVGVTAAKTLAYATGAMLLALDSLHAIGRNAPVEAARIAVIADAQRNDLYVARLSRSAPGLPPSPEGETRIEPLESWVGSLEPGTVVLGPALDLPRVRSAVPVAFLAPPDVPDHPQAVHLLELARDAFHAGRRENPWLLEPCYLRRSAAEDQWDARGPGHRG